MLVGKHLCSLERVLLSMSTRIWPNDPSDHHIDEKQNIIPHTHLFRLSKHNYHHHPANHHNPHAYSHHLRRHRLRHRRRLYPSTWVLLDPCRRRAKLPQIPANLTPERLARPRHPLRQHLRGPIQHHRRPARRADRYQRYRLVRQRRPAAESVGDLFAGHFHEHEELVWDVRFPGRYGHVERSGCAEAECRCLVCV